MKGPYHDKKEIVSDCLERCVDLLKKNSGPHGINAASHSKKAEGRNYASIFGRDAAICSLGMIVSGNAELIRSARRSILTLAKYQAPNGQIPKFVKPEKDEVDFWYSGCIDATLWWLIAVDFYERSFPVEKIKNRLEKKIDLALYWLRCQEHQGLYLLQQNEASDWADIMPRSGFVLYTNALWYYVKNLYQIADLKKTKHFFRNIFSPFDKTIPENRRARILAHYVKKKEQPKTFYLSFVNLAFWGPEVDVYGNLLSMLFGLSPETKSLHRVNELISIKAHEPWPVKSVVHPIRQNSPLWRTYMERYEQNYPYQYHNGGIWPYVSGFWVMLLHKLGRKKLARKELERYAEVNSINNWEFNEWFHGKTGKLMGMAGQSWNAAMFLLAYHCVHDNNNLFP
jgi:glycogen debranching enzyme